jgi:acetyl/propionyl-CoA carboxylase alpha subunit
VRVDDGVQDGGEIPMATTSMIAKLIVHEAPPGGDCQDECAEAPNGFVTRHQQSNIPFQAGALLAHPKFAVETSTTGLPLRTTPMVSRERRRTMLTC